MTDSELVNKILLLLRNKPQYHEVLQNIVSWYERKFRCEKCGSRDLEPVDNSKYLYRCRKCGHEQMIFGFEAHEVNSMPAYLYKLYNIGVLKITYKSRRYTNYMPADINAIKRALEIYGKSTKSPEYDKPIKIPKDLFKDIVGLEDVKKTIIKALKSKKPIHILLVGPPASVTGDTEIIVMSKKGIEITPIREIYERFHNGEKFLALSINPKTLKTEWKPILDVIYHGKREVVKIKLRGGRTIKVTKDHSLFTYKNGQLIPIKCSTLKQNDYIAIVYRFDIPNRIDNIDGIELDYNLGFATGVWLADGSIGIYKRWDGKVETYVDIANNDPEIRRKFAEGIKHIDPSYTPLKVYNKRNTRRTYRKSIYKYFRQFVTDEYERRYGKGRSAYSKYIPPWVFISNKQFITGLIQGFFSGDARKKEPYFTIASKQLRDGIAILLMELGIPTTYRTVEIKYKGERRTYYELRVIKSFAEKLGMEYETSYNHDEIFGIPLKEPHIRDLLGIGTAKKLYNELTKLLNSDVLFSKIESIEYLGYDDVYDLSVKDNENFVAYNGILLHNTAKSLIMEELWQRIENAHLILAGTSTKAGIREIIAEFTPRILLIDELDKINDSRDLSVLLSWMEHQRIVIAMRDRYEVVKCRYVDGCKVIAACNTDRFLPPELKSRFLIIRLKPYTREEFINIVKSILINREGIEPELAEYIAVKCADRLKTRDPRDAIKIASLVSSKEEVDWVIDTLLKYR